MSGEDPLKWKVVEDLGDEVVVEANKDQKSIKLEALGKDAYYEVQLVANNAQGSSHEERRIIKTSAGGEC